MTTRPPRVLAVAAAEPLFESVDRDRLVVRGTHPSPRFADQLGPRPDVVFALRRDADRGAELARWYRVPLLVDARGMDAPSLNGSGTAIRAACRVLAEDDAHAAVLAEHGVDAGRILRVGASASPSPASEPGPVTHVDSLAAAIDEVVRLARGRDIARRPAGAYGAIKRAMDLVVACTLIVLLAPLLLVVAVLIKLDSPGPVLFRQRRIGRASSEFTICKFRTMFTGTPDLASHLMGPGSSRITPLGRFLRRASIDELPQLWHLLTGEMSLVGPRPALHNQYDLIGMRQRDGIDALTPGVTGWAQVNGRDDIPLTRKVELDRHYLERVSLAEDIAILFRTVIVLFSDRGTY